VPDVHNPRPRSTPAPSGAGRLPPEVEAAIAAIAAEARRALPGVRVLLFGSRARGDFRPESDIDLAFEHQGSSVQWADFVNAQLETAPTLLAIDLLDLSVASDDLRAKVYAEGRPV
jgi:predicted nucleotidyltransferase